MKIVFKCFNQREFKFLKNSMSQFEPNFVRNRKDLGYM